nr:MAG TPA: hypothetical protein [Caudoviricetes sp.]
MSSSGEINSTCHVEFITVKCLPRMRCTFRTLLAAALL